MRKEVKKATRILKERRIESARLYRAGHSFRRVMDEIGLTLQRDDRYLLKILRGTLVEDGVRIRSFRESHRTPISRIERSERLVGYRRSAESIANQKRTIETNGGGWRKIAVDGDRIRRLAAKGKTQYEIASILGVSRSTVQRNCYKFGIKCVGGQNPSLQERWLAAHLRISGVPILTNVSVPEIDRCLHWQHPCDIVVPDLRLVIEVDGCWNHGGCDLVTCSYYRSHVTLLPRHHNRMNRDRLIDAAVKKAGWRIIRIWSHDVGWRDYSPTRRVIDLVDSLPKIDRKAMPDLTSGEWARMDLAIQNVLVLRQIRRVINRKEPIHA